MTLNSNRLPFFLLSPTQGTSHFLQTFFSFVIRRIRKEYHCDRASCVNYGTNIVIIPSSTNYITNYYVAKRYWCVLLKLKYKAFYLYSNTNTHILFICMRIMYTHTYRHTVYRIRYIYTHRMYTQAPKGRLVSSIFRLCYDGNQSSDHAGAASYRRPTPSISRTHLYGLQNAQDRESRVYSAYRLPKLFTLLAYGEKMTYLVVEFYLPALICQGNDGVAWEQVVAKTLKSWEVEALCNEWDWKI